MPKEKVAHRPHGKRAGTASDSEPTAIEASSSDRVARAIYEGIFDGRYVPGQKLIEADLAASLGLSRGPIREGLKHLAAQGVLELTPHRGAYVRAMARHEAIDLLAIIGALLNLVVRNAADAASDPETAKQVQAAFAKVGGERVSPQSDTEWIMQREHFYDTLIRVAGNSQMDAVFPRMLIHLLRLQTEPMIAASDRAARRKEYEAVTLAVLKGDAAAAQRAMRTHVRRMLGRIENLPDRAFASPTSS